MSIADSLAKLIELKNQLVANLKSMGVAADESEKLNTLVPKVLECGTVQNVEWVDNISDKSGSSSCPGIVYMLKKIDIPDGTTIIPEYAFSGCSNLESVSIPGSVTSIENYSFDECTMLENIYITDIVNWCNVVFGTAAGGNPLNTNNIQKNIYINNELVTDLVIPDGVTSIGKYSFCYCNLKSIIISDSVTSIGVCAFRNCNILTDVIIGDSVTSIGEHAFEHCTGLTTLTFPEGVTSINNGILYDCTSLKSVIIPKGVTSIGAAVFSNCTNLSDIYYTGTSSQWSSITKGTNWNYNMGSSVSGGTVIHYNYIDTPYNVYGVIWDGSSSTKLIRTNDSEKFSNPVSALGGTGGSSPFDSCYPWSEIERVTIDGNELVKIPKFWYRIVKHNESLSFQIADGPVEGFNVSPAHADRGDGVGERDYVYIGRYKCTSSNYKSVTNTPVMTNITRATARSSITSLGSGYYMQDFALWWTVRMLYLVEFADWNSQKVIGYGCGNDRSTVNTGTTDSMSYHTGTIQSWRTTYGTGVQYRWIEDPWGNVIEWCDGIRFSGSDVYVFNNPSEYSDTTGGIKIGTRPTSGGYISQWSVPSVSGYDWALYPSAARGSDSTYITDYCYYYSSGVVLSVGGAYGQYQHNGAFYLNGFESASGSVADVGVRLQYLP